MHHWTPREQKAARQIGIPANPGRIWWWRARNVINGEEHARLAHFVTWLQADIARRRELQVV